MALRLRSRKSVFTTLPEGQAPQPRGAGTGRLVYFAVIIAILGYVAWFLAQRLLAIEAIGIVEPDLLPLRAPHGAMISELPAREGAAVAQGQLLFSLHKPVEADTGLALERLRSERALAERRAERDGVAAELGAKRRLLAEVRRQRLLEINRERAGEAIRLAADIETLQRRDKALAAEIAALQGYAAALSGQDRSRASTLVTAHTAPFAAQVLKVDREPREFVREGERILLLRHTQRARVVGYFAADQLKYLAPGKPVRVRFADGTEAQGRLGPLRSAALEETELLKSRYLPLDVAGRAEVELTGIDAAALLRHEMMNVRITAWRWE